MLEVEQFYPETKQHWRAWLEQNHQLKDAVWLIMYNKKSTKSTIKWSDAVDEALCFGWIDSKKIKIDDERVHQFFSKRKPQSTWSKINKDKVEKLIEQGLMTNAGYKSIEIAKENRSWNILDEVEALVIPLDLEKAFGRYVGSKDYFISLSKSVKKMMLQWIVLAKRPETRNNRIEEIVFLASQSKKPKQF